MRLRSQNNSPNGWEVPLRVPARFVSNDLNELPEAPPEPLERDANEMRKTRLRLPCLINLVGAPCGT